MDKQLNAVTVALEKMAIDISEFDLEEDKEIKDITEKFKDARMK